MSFNKDKAFRNILLLPMDYQRQQVRLGELGTETRRYGRAIPGVINIPEYVYVFDELDWNALGNVDELILSHF